MCSHSNMDIYIHLHINMKKVTNLYEKERKEL